MLLLPGAFNPVTTAHLALAQAAQQAHQQQAAKIALFCILSTHTINKEGTERATLLDRLLVLHLLAQRLGWLGVLLTNQGLYVEQAEAARHTFPHAQQVRFVVGWDKVAQIFDVRYYVNRNVALHRLFSLADLLAAPRADYEAADLAALMQQPENQPFQAALRWLTLPANARDISSSQIRTLLQQELWSETPSGETPLSAEAEAALLAWLPPEARLFCQESRCYHPPQPLPSGEAIDHYGLRVALIQRALALSYSAGAERQIALHPLYLLAISTTPQGQALRRWLNSPQGATHHTGNR
jgi:nicotinic acid mononucleotide adenylyltransferase